MLDQRDVYGDYPVTDDEILLWFEGSGAPLFDSANSDSAISDRDGDGENDTITYVEMVRLARPIPAGVYQFDLKEARSYYAPCNFVISNEWTVAAAAPEGVLHEAFFDPVTVGNAVAADTTNGVLKPTTFTGTNGASATIESITWESGRVKVKIVPWSTLSGHVLDFIELDSTASLSLNLSNSAVEVATDTLTWSVSSQPWEDGDKLMVRIREAPPFANPPANLTATASGEDAVDLSWAPVRDASGYHVQSRESGEETWETVDAGVTKTAYTVSGLSCATTYEFRVGTYGDGTRYDTRVVSWSETSATTDECTQPPVFDSASYSFEVSVEATVGTEVGTVSATDPNADAVTYSIVGGFSRYSVREPESVALLGRSIVTRSCRSM